ncbi:hypothetical protein [Marinobacterium arenosum]|uniref:hypothetical protein n=1 Tax=Marinobacterium arenosum TaxID=2862496 RepID=UPI001C94C435|nr:hypothetical protein [Marinobacterium arenosum]MBY4678333.1 hypothetical protein [Marinobacterium arenosum]
MADYDRTVSLLSALLLVALLPAWGEACDSEVGTGFGMPQSTVPSSQQWLDPLCDGMTVLAVLRIENEDRLAPVSDLVPYGLQFRPAISDAFHAAPAPLQESGDVVRVLPVSHQWGVRQLVDYVAPLADGLKGCGLGKRLSGSARHWM